MKTSDRHNSIIFYVFLAAGACLSIVISLTDFLSETDTTNLKYFGIILCACFAAYSTSCGKKYAITVLCALIFTLISDYFLLVKDDNYELGVCSFIVAQSLYFARIYLEKKKFPTVSLSIRLLVFTVGIVIIYVSGLAEFLTIAAVLYACMLTGNVIESYTDIKLGVYRILFAVGLTLFACCDICVMLYNLNSFIDVSISQKTLNTIVNSAWVFYLPSQILISLSSMPIKNSQA